MTNSCLHEIKINNYKEEETILHSVILIRGFITNYNNCSNNSEIIIIKTNNNKTNETKHVGGKFKILLELQHGKNQIVLNYHTISKEIAINYEISLTKYTIQPLYIICKGHNGEFQAPMQENNSIESAISRITIGAKLLQCVMADKMAGLFKIRKTFKLKSNCIIFDSNLNYLEAKQMKADILWEEIAREIMNSNIFVESVKYLGFLSCTEYKGYEYEDKMDKYEDFIKLTDGYIALGGGGLALFGTASLFTWPENIENVLKSFLNNNKIDRKQFLDDSCYRGTVGGVYSTTLGSVLHELCHTFDLGHTQIGVMGRGFDNIDKFFTIGNNEKAPNLNVFNYKLEFQEEFEPDLLSERLKEKKKDIRVLEQIEVDENNIFWTRSCLNLLNYHKWFNNFPNCANTLKFDFSSKFLLSTFGLRVIELRDSKGNVLDSYIFDGKILKYSFQIPEESSTNFELNKISLVAEDNVGNLLKLNLF